MSYPCVDSPLFFSLDFGNYMRMRIINFVRKKCKANKQLQEKNDYKAITKHQGDF